MKRIAHKTQSNVNDYGLDPTTRTIVKLLFCSDWLKMPWKQSERNNQSSVVIDRDFFFVEVLTMVVQVILTLSSTDSIM